MVKVLTGPLQLTALLVYTGVTVIVAVIAADELLVAVNGAMLPVPLAASPMAALLFVHWYDVPVPAKLIRDVVAPLHTVTFDG